MTEPSEERRLMKRNKEHFDRLFYVADAEYGIPTQCACGGRMVEEVAGPDKVVNDTQPGRRFFVCKDYKADGLHFRQPWVLGVEEEISKLTKQVEDSEKLIKELFELSYKEKRLKAEEIERLNNRVDKLTSRVAKLEIMTLARALNSIFAAWKIRSPSQWNISGELCSSAAIDVAVPIDSNAFNPLIKCDCSFVNSTICRITALKVYAMDVIGPIPQDLWTLEYLTNLNLGQNVLTGSLPPAIGNLTRMQWMTFGINALSGPFPKEIGLLTDLRLLGIGSNNFSGSIPAEIESCTKLQQLYIDSSGLSGIIPLSFANLVQLEQVWIMDLDLTGRIPDFIGNWTKLTTLRIIGTGLNGPIPSSFSNLTSLLELRLSDISSGSSSLEFIKDMKSLSVL